MRSIRSPERAGASLKFGLLRTAIVNILSFKERTQNQDRSLKLEMLAIIRHPVIGGLLTFAFTVIGVFLAVVIWFLWITRNVDCSTPGDPCDGPGLLFMGLMAFTVPTALFVGAVTGAIASAFLANKRNKPR